MDMKTFFVQVTDSPETRIDIFGYSDSCEAAEAYVKYDWNDLHTEGLTEGVVDVDVEDEEGKVWPYRVKIDQEIIVDARNRK
jgi:hypothetical protein